MQEPGEVTKEEKRPDLGKETEQKNAGPDFGQVWDWSLTQGTEEEPAEKRVFEHNLSKQDELIPEMLDFLRNRLGDKFSIDPILEEGDWPDRPAMIGIDGRCGSGKTSFAKLLSTYVPCNVVHMDDFYIPMEKRRKDWREVPGGNIDFHRLLSEVLHPLYHGKPVFYRAYNCREDKLEETMEMRPRRYIIVEGTYSLHFLLSRAYDLKIFTDISPEDQIQNLREREGDNLEKFIEQWIPMEENYFKEFSVRQRSHAIINWR
jgi:uridine kinase